MRRRPVLAILAGLALLAGCSGGADEVDVADATSTTGEGTSTTQRSTTTTSSTSTTLVSTTEPPPPVTEPPVTAPPATAPPVTVPPTTAPPEEVEVPPRSQGEVPAYRGILTGQVFGGGGGFNVDATCNPGSFTVTIHESGDVAGVSDGLYLIVTVDDSAIVYQADTNDGQVISGSSGTRLRMYTNGPPTDPYRIQYDCLNA